MTEVRKYIRVAEVSATSDEYRSVLKRFINAAYAFVISHTTDGVVFRLVTDNITACLGLNNGVMLPGKTVEALLRSLSINDGNLDRALAEVKMPVKLFTLETWTVNEPSRHDAEPCYRTYLSSVDLHKILSFPLQSEYETWGDVYVVPATTSLRQGETLHRITIPLEQLYTVVCPKGVDADPEQVLKGERMTLTFNKPGFTSQSITLSAGSPSPFVKYEGAAIVVNPLESVGINFTRRIPVIVRSARGRAVEGYSITINERPVNTSRPFIDLTERDLMPGSVVEIVVRSTNFRPLVLKLPVEQADMNTPLELVLQPERQVIVLRLNFEDGTMVEHELALERNDPRYSSLHAGSYCGFRAHRISEPGETECFNVEVKSSAGIRDRSVSHNGISESAEITPDNESVQPKDASAEAAVGDQSNALRSKRKRYVPIWIICIGIVLAVVAAGYAVLYLPGWFSVFNSDEDAVDAVDVTGFVTDTLSVPVQTVTVDTISPVAPEAVVATEVRDTVTSSPVTTNVFSDLNPDIRYLNTKKVWRRADLTTDEGRHIYDLIGKGNIDEILADPYFSSSNASINPMAGKIADFLWQAKGTPTHRSNEVALRKMKDQPSIDLWKLWEALGRVRPAEPNQGKRP